MSQSQLLHSLPRHLCPAGGPLHENGACKRDWGKWHFFQRPQDCLLWHPHAPGISPTFGGSWRGQHGFVSQRRWAGGGWRAQHWPWRWLKRLELRASQESEGQVQAEDEESEEDLSREESCCACGVCAVHTSPQVPSNCTFYTKLSEEQQDYDLDTCVFKSSSPAGTHSYHESSSSVCFSPGSAKSPVTWRFPEKVSSCNDFTATGPWRGKVEMAYLCYAGSRPTCSHNDILTLSHHSLRHNSLQ